MKEESRRKLCVHACVCVCLEAGGAFKEGLSGIFFSFVPSCRRSRHLPSVFLQRSSSASTLMRRHHSWGGVASEWFRTKGSVSSQSLLFNYLFNFGGVILNSLRPKRQNDRVTKLKRRHNTVHWLSTRGAVVGWQSGQRPEGSPQGSGLQRASKAQSRLSHADLAPTKHFNIRAFFIWIISETAARRLFIKAPGALRRKRDC